MIAWSNPPSSITVSARQVSDWELTKTTVEDEEVTYTPALARRCLASASDEGSGAQKLRLVPYAGTELRLAEIFPYLKASPDAKPGSRWKSRNRSSLPAHRGSAAGTATAAFGALHPA